MKGSRVLWCGAYCLGWLAFSAPTLADNQGTSYRLLVVELRDPQGAIVSDATVEAVRTDGTSVKGVAIADGSYLFNGVTFKTTLAIEHTLFGPWQEEVMVDSPLGWITVVLGETTGNMLMQPPPNDLCDDRIPINVPSFTLGTTIDATIDAEFPFCGTDITSPGVWYSVMGTGTTMTATTCGPFFGYDTKISVYCGTCGDPTCVDGNDDNCPPFNGLLSTVTWCGQAGAEYLILVHAFGGQTGDFELDLSEDGVPCEPQILCIPTGACCLEDGTCANGLTEDDCLAGGGEYQGDGTACEGGFIGFVVEDCANAFEDISGTGTLGPSGDDNGDVVPIGFDFNFYGDSHSQIGMGTNGYLTFGPDLTDFSNDPIPTSTDPNDLIAPLWDDYVVDGAGATYYETLGTMPNRRFIAQWTNIRQFGDSDSNTFQAILFEGTNCIEFRYGPFTPENPPGDYTIGVENQTGTDGEAIDAQTVAPDDCRSLCPQFTDPIECAPPVEAFFDLKPTSCPNSFNTRGQGLLPAALLGTDTFDVELVDPDSLLLSRTDGVGGSVAPIRTGIEDVATPLFDRCHLCECHELGPDGFMDLTMKFNSQDVTDILVLNPIFEDPPHGTARADVFIELVLSGTLLDGTPFEAPDCLRIVPGANALNE